MVQKMNILRRDWTKLENLCLSSQALRRAEWSQRGAPLLHLGWWWRQVTATQILKKNKTSTSRFLWLQLTAGHRTISRNQTQRNKSILSGRRLESVYLRYQDWESAELGMFMSHTYWCTTHIFQWYFLLFDYCMRLCCSNVWQGNIVQMSSEHSEDDLFCSLSMSFHLLSQKFLPY